jgi:iron complex outermembrane receptor protein
MNAETDANTYSYGGRTEGTWTFDDGKFYSGIDLKIERAEGKRNRKFLVGPNTGKTVYDNVWNDGQVSNAGIFGEYHHYFSSVNMMFSGRLEYNKAKATDVDPGFEAKNPQTDKTQVNPNFSVGCFKDYANGLSIGLWLGRAQRSGGITERYVNSFPVGLDAYDMLGNPQLDPEVNNQIDLTISYKKDYLAIDVGGFVSFLQNYISSVIDTGLSPTMPSSPGVRRFMNIKDAFMAGFELDWRQRLLAGLEHHVNMAFTYGEDNVRNEPLAEIAPLDFRYSLSGSYLNSTLRPVITFRYVMKQDRISNAFGETETPSFSILDLGLTYQISKSLGASAGVQNLFDEAYYEHLNRFVKGQTRPIHAPGRNVYFSLFIDLM